MNQCPFCSSFHGEIYQRFANFSCPDIISKTDCVDFLNSVKFEIKEGNWLEVYCFVSTIIKQEKFYNSNNYSANQFWLLCTALEKIMRTNPNMSSVENLEKINNDNHDKIANRLTNRIKSEITQEELDEEFLILRKLTRVIYEINENNRILQTEDTVSSNSLLSEEESEFLRSSNSKFAIDVDSKFIFVEANQNIPTKSKIVRTSENKLVTITKSLDDAHTNDILKNYLLVRLVSFYERKIGDELSELIDEIPKQEFKELKSLFGGNVSFDPDQLYKLDRMSIGKLAIMPLDNSPAKLNDMIRNILKSRYGRQAINEKFDIFDVMSYTFTYHASIQDELIKIGGWFKFIQEVNKERNTINHELSNYQMSIDLALLVVLYEEFMKNFQNLIKIVLDHNNPSIKTVDKKKDYENMKSALLRSNSNGSNKKTIIEIIPYEEFSRNLTFDLQAKKNDSDNFQKNNSFVRKLYPCICSDCGKSTKTPFNPRSDTKSYCLTCLPKHKKFENSKK